MVNVKLVNITGNMTWNTLGKEPYSDIGAWRLVVGGGAAEREAALRAGSGGKRRGTCSLRALKHTSGQEVIPKTNVILFVKTFNQHRTLLMVTAVNVCKTIWANDFAISLV